VQNIAFKTVYVVGERYDPTTFIHKGMGQGNKILCLGRKK